MPSIRFFNEGTRFKLPHPRLSSNWLKQVISSEGFQPGDINYIFCSDDYLMKINVEYLNHHTLTDIITFDTSETDKTISGDIYISVDRVNANSVLFQTTSDDELHRVLVHGILHLMGYGDKNRNQKSQMRKKEDAYLSLRKD